MDSIPNEILVSILEFVPYRYSTSLVCKKWRSCIRKIFRTNPSSCINQLCKGDNSLQSLFRLRVLRQILLKEIKLSEIQVIREFKCGEFQELKITFDGSNILINIAFVCTYNYSFKIRFFPDNISAKIKVLLNNQHCGEVWLMKSLSVREILEDLMAGIGFYTAEGDFDPDEGVPVCCEEPFGHMRRVFKKIILATQNLLINNE